MTSERASLGGPPPPDLRRGLPRSTGSDVGKQELNKGKKRKETIPSRERSKGEKKGIDKQEGQGNWQAMRWHSPGRAIQQRFSFARENKPKGKQN